MSESIDQYKFTIVDGQVVAVYEFESLDPTDTWVVSGAQVTRTETDDGVVKTTVFVDTDLDGLYAKTSNGIEGPEKYQFDIVSNQVTGYWERESIESGETWTVDGTQVIQTRIKDGVEKTTVYDDADANGIYTKVSQSYSGSDDSTALENYKFTFDGSLVTSVQEFEKGAWKTDSMDADETWTLQPDGSVTKVEAEHGFLETTVFVDTDLDGLYSKAEKIYTALDGSNTVILAGNEHGDDGNDKYNGTAGDDYYYGGDGNDKINGGSGDDDLNGGSGNDRIIGGNGDDVIYAGSGNDHVTAGNGDDLIIGGDGAGDDFYQGEAGSDTVTYTSAQAGITVDLQKGYARSALASSDAGIGSDKLKNIENAVGGDFNDTLIGTNGANTLVGGAGDDTLVGGKGVDSLSGGEGNDLFRFTSVSDSKLGSMDVITDFAVGDRIDLSAIDAMKGGSKNDSFTLIDHASLDATNANGALWFDDGVLYGSTDKDLSAEFSIELTGVATISVSDLIL